MKVMNIQTKEVVEATKNEDDTYTVEGKKIARGDMKGIYTMVKEKTKAEPVKQEVESLNIVESESDMSEGLGELGKALAQCQGEFQAVQKGTKAFNYNYADLEAVLAASREITSKHELAITQLNLSKVVGDTLLVGVNTVLIHSSGEYISSSIYVPASRTKSNTLVQMAGVNVTYLRRYGIQSILGLATTDTDGK